MNRERVTVWDVLESIARACDGDTICFGKDEDDDTFVTVDLVPDSPLIFRLGTGQTFRITVEEVK